MIQSMIIDQVMWPMVEKMAFVAKDMRDLLQIRAINSRLHATQPENSVKVLVRRDIITNEHEKNTLFCLFAGNYIPQVIIPMLISSFVSILCIT